MIAWLAQRIRERQEQELKNEVFRLFSEAGYTAQAYKCRAINVTTELYKLLMRRRMDWNHNLGVPIEDDSLPLAFRGIPIVSDCEKLELVF